MTRASAPDVERIPVRPMTDSAHQRLRGPNVRPLPSQRSCRKNAAETQARTKVTPRPNTSRGMSCPFLRAGSRPALKSITVGRATANGVPYQDHLGWARAPEPAVFGYRLSQRPEVTRVIL